MKVKESVSTIHGQARFMLSHTASNGHVLHSKAKHLSGAELEGWDSGIMKLIPCPSKQIRDYLVLKGVCVCVCQCYKGGPTK